MFGILYPFLIQLCFAFLRIYSSELLLTLTRYVYESENKISVPENLDFEGKFEDIFEKYLSSYTYEEVKTSNMGSLYKITLSVALKAGVSTKAMIDEIRTRNGNLDISLGRQIDNAESL